MYKYGILLIVSQIILVAAFCQETLVLNTDKTFYHPGDTIRLNMRVAEWEGTQKLGTVNVLVEDFNHQNLWRFRYPMVEGYFFAELIIPDSLPGNRYVISAQLQPRFFQLTGKMVNRNKEDSLRYTMQLEDKSLIAGILPLNEEGAFRMPRHLFSGRATLFFTPKKIGKGKNQTDVRITTPLDSAYIPIATASQTIDIGLVPGETAFIRYAPDTNMLNNQTTLAKVTVIGKVKTPVQNFDEQNASGFFKQDRSTIFSGLDGEFSGFFTILDYLQGRVPGLTILKNNEEFGQYDVFWRNEPTAFFLDEIPVDLETIYSFPPSEMAMVKVFPPPFNGMILGASGGAIAIYSKRAGTSGQSRYRNRFVVQGFSPSVSVLKPINRGSVNSLDKRAKIKSP